MKHFLRQTFIIVFIWPVFAGQAQDTLPVLIPLAPNSAALERVKNYQMNPFTGVPNITIPLYTVKTSAFEVPISLIYHASGIRISDFPSYVGAGWALDAGGQLNRTCVGRPDEGPGGYLSGSVEAPLSIDISTSVGYTYLKNCTQNFTDVGSDVYSYNFPGGSGKFIYDTTFTPLQIPYTPNHIQSGGGAYTITDPSGNTMRFGPSYRENGYYITSSDAPTGPVFNGSSWMLEKMRSPDHLDSVSFNYYAQSDAITSAVPNDTWTVDDQVDNLGTGNSTYQTQDGNVPNLDWAQTGSYTMAEIQFSNGKVEFDLDSLARLDFGQTGNSKALKRIRILSSTSAGDVLVKSFTFFYGYFGTGTSSRLRLDSLQESDQNGLVVGTYRFTYNTSVSLPAPTARSKDFWGYYNGKSNDYLVPQTTIYYNAHSSDPNTFINIGSRIANGRDPDSTYMQAGVLTRIAYPTGGHADFQYETNRYIDDSARLKLAGGLRVKNIQYYDGYNAAPMIKTYKYGLGENGVGRANFRLENYWLSTTQTCDYYSGIPANSIISTKRHRNYYSRPTISIDPYDGAPVVYAYVTEYDGNGDGVLGKTIYQFTDDADLGTPGDFPLVISHYYNRGQPLSKKVYKTTSPGIYQPVSEDRYTYNTPAFPTAAATFGIYVNRPVVKEGNATYQNDRPGDWVFNYMWLNSDDNYVTSHTSILYNPDDSTKFVSSFTGYTYTNFTHQQPTRTVSLNSKGDTLITETRYPADYISGGTGQTGVTILDTMLGRNMQTFPVETWSKRKTGASDSVVLSGSFNQYEQLSNGLVEKALENELTSASPLTNFQPAYVSGTALQIDTRYTNLFSLNQYDNFGNIEEDQKASDLKTVYLWGYSGRYPVAKIVGSNYATVSSVVPQHQIDTAISNGHGTLMSVLNTLRTDSRTKHALISTYSYAPLVGITSQCDPSGKVTTYTYDTFGRLKLIIDQFGNIIKRYDYEYQTSNQ